MQIVWIYLINIIVAAFIGGFTNHLAIKMLFHPRKEIRIGGRKLPFTPGLIPKRRNEIATSLGKVVAEYLVTSNGIVRVLRKSDFKQNIEHKLQSWIATWSMKEETIRELLLQFINEEQLEAGQVQLKNWSKSQIRGGITWMWEEKQWSSKQIKDVIPKWSPELKEQWSLRVSQYVIRELKLKLNTLQGELLLKQLIGQVLGGILGGLASMFMDADSIAKKLKQALLEQMDSQMVSHLLSSFIHEKITEWENKSLAELLQMITEDSSADGLMSMLEKHLPWDEMITLAGNSRISSIMNHNQDTLSRFIPNVTNLGIELIANNVEKILKALNLPEMVEEQVSHFPIERLEEIILNVSGREFKAITWLGVLLGAIIGFIQVLINQVFM